MTRSGAAEVGIGSKAGESCRSVFLRLRALLQPAGFRVSRGRLGFGWDGGGSRRWDRSSQLSGGWEGGDRDGGVELGFSSGGGGGGSHGDQRLHELFLIPEMVEIGDASLQVRDGTVVAEDGLAQLVAAITTRW